MKEMLKNTEKKKYDSIAYRTWREYIVGKLYGDGVYFFSLHIDLLEYWQEVTNLHNIYKNFTLEEVYKLVKTRDISDLKSMLAGLDMADFAYIVIKTYSEEEEVIDKRKQGYPYIQMLLGVRSLTGDYDYLKNIILNSLLLKGFHYVKVAELLNEKLIVSYWNNIVRQVTYTEDFKKHYMYMFNYDPHTYGNFLDFIDSTNNPLLFADYGAITHKHTGIIGINRSYSSNKYILINLWRIFMQKLEIFNNNSKLYQKNSKSRCSYIKLGGLEIFMVNFPDIFLTLKEIFPQQMAVNVNYLVSDHVKEALDLVIIDPAILPTKEILYNLVEFNDGVYDLELNAFNSSSIVKDGLCIYYFQVSYFNYFSKLILIYYKIHYRLLCIFNKLKLKLL